MVAGEECDFAASAESCELWFRVNRGQLPVTAIHCNVPTAEEPTQAVEGMAKYATWRDNSLQRRLREVSWTKQSNVLN